MPNKVVLALKEPFRLVNTLKILFLIRKWKSDSGSQPSFVMLCRAVTMLKLNLFTRN